MTMDVPSEDVAPRLPTKSTGIEEDFEAMSVQRVAEIAASAHRSGDDEEQQEDDAHTDLLHFPVTKRPSFMTRKSGPLMNQMGAPRRSQSMRAARSGDIGGPTGLGSRSFHRTDPSLGIARVHSLRGPNTAGLTRHSGINRRAPPGRSVSNDSLRPYRRDLLANTSLENRDRFNLEQKEPIRSVDRTKSGDSFASFASDLDSCFTTDSVSLRKHQLIADPLEDGDYTYDESCSYADHESIYGTLSMATQDFEAFNEGIMPTMGPIRRTSGISIGEVTFGTKDSIKVRRHQLPSQRNTEPANKHDDESCRSRSNSCSSFDTTDIDFNEVYLEGGDDTHDTTEDLIDDVDEKDEEYVKND